MRDVMAMLETLRVQYHKRPADWVTIKRLADEVMHHTEEMVAQWHPLGQQARAEAPCEQ
jgi:hypothetical protein